MSQNFPGSPNTGTSLVNNRVTGNTIPASDHNDLVDAHLAVEAKLGSGASVPSVAGQVLTATAAGVSAWQTPAGGGGGGGVATYFNVKSYGALGNGANNDTAAIQAAINAALATSRGTATVFFPAGTYKITATLNCSSATNSASGKGVILRGEGHEASQIFKNNSFGVAVSWKGFGGPANNPTQFGGMRDISVNCNVSIGGAIEVIGGQQMFFRGVSVLGSNDVAMMLDTTQDSYFSQMTFNNCGSITAPVINIYGSADGTSNMLWFDQIRVETFLNGAVWIKAPTAQRAGNGGNNGFFFSQCKFENYPTVRGDIFVCDSWTQQLEMSQIFISFGQYASGYSTPANGIVFGDGGSSPGHNQAAFRDIFMNSGPAAGIGASAVKINGGGNLLGPVTIDNVYCDYPLSSGVVNVTGAAGLNLSMKQLGVTGNGLLVAGDGSGHDAKGGSGTLVAGTATVTNKFVNASSRIIATPTSTGANSGILYIANLVAGTSFQVKSSNGSDTANFNWMIVN